MGKEDEDNTPLRFVDTKPTIRIDPATLLRYEEDVEALTRILTFSGNVQSEIGAELMILRMLMTEARKPPLKIQESLSNLTAAKLAALDMLSYVTKRSSLNIVPPDRWKTLLGQMKTISPRALQALKTGLIEETKTDLQKLVLKTATSEDWNSFCEVVALLSELPWEK